MDQEPDSLDEFVFDSVIHLEAIICLLEAKGLMTEEEILDEVKKIRTMLAEKRKAD